MFKTGDRVKLNAVWMKHSGGFGHQINSKATVVGQSRNLGCVRIVFDGQRTPNTFHQSFLTKIERIK
jgi:hypothetical protein